MERLVDYIVLLELDESQLRHGSSVGTITQRLPEKDWADVPFSPSLNVFCMPQGWHLSHEQLPPTYCVGTLTDLMGTHQYACTLQFYEPVSYVPLEVVEDTAPTDSVFYKPKVLVLLTRFTFFEFFRMCVRKIHCALLEGGDLAENIAATLLTAIPRSKVPYNITLGQERFMLRATTHSKVPMTGTVVNDLIRYLGSLHNLILLYRCILYDQKIVLHSKSMNRLSNASYAIKAIVYPMEYTYPFVPLLPEELLECLESPTPFLMGILTSHSEKVAHVDAYFVNLDTGEVKMPTTTELPSIPSPFLERLVMRLQTALSPELETSDMAETVALPPTAEAFILDKRIRACFLLFLAEVLYGYRTCLQLVRLHGSPLIVFHKSAFIGLRHVDSTFLQHMLQGQMFQLFVTTRGVPYRECDIFDDVVCRNPYLSTRLDPSTVLENILEIADFFARNEQQEHYLPTTPYPKEIGCIRKLNDLRVEKLILEELEQSKRKKAVPNLKLVPSPTLEVSEEINNSRRINVLNSCIDAIFDNRLPEARRMMNAVELALRIVESRVYLCRQLSQGAIPVTRAMLNPQQFDLIVRLINCALEQETDEDEHGIGYACLHLCNLYCRRLTQGVHQYAYTCVQEHAVWSNPRFWEAAFFHDVHELMRHSYGSVPAAEFPLKGNNRFGMWNLCEKPTGMEVAADVMQTETELTQEKLQEYKDEEDAIVYGQAKHYINLMVCMKIPLDPSRLRRIDKADLELRGNALGRRDLKERAEVESDTESGYADNCNDGDIGSTVVKWISGLIDRLCLAAQLDSSKVDRLTSDIPGFVAVHIDNLEQVYSESRKIVPPPKAKLPVPVMLTPIEKVLVGGLRSVLLSTEKIDAEHPEAVRYPLPAEGAVYLTNYRIVFKGQPLNPFLSDGTIVRSMPIMSVVKEKNISDSHLHSHGFMDLIPSKIANGLHDGLQIRSSCFILMNLAFDEDVSAEEAEEFSKQLAALRWPVTLPQTLYAYAPVAHMLTTTLPPSQKNKMNTIRDLKKTISKPLGSIMKRHESRTLSPKSLTQPRQNVTITNESDYLDLGGDTLTYTSDSRHYLQDYERLRLKSENSLFRLSYANTYHDIVKNYPSCFIVPCSSSDATFAKVSKGFKNGRLPVITWISENGALLIRGAGFNVSGNVLTKIKKANLLHPTDSASAIGSQSTLNSRETSSDIPHSTTSSSSELQDAYISRLAQSSPAFGNIMASWDSQESSFISLESLLTAEGTSQFGNTPDLSRKAPSGERPASTFIRSSGGKSGTRFIGIQSSLSSVLNPALVSRANKQIISNLVRKNLYVLVDKGQQKNIKVDKNTTLVPITYPSNAELKVAFKKVLRATRPGDLASDSSSFYKALEDSKWRTILAQALGLASYMSAVIDCFNSSVALCIEEGYDITCVLMSLVQILQDSHYRTFEGFRILVEKEWMAFGYRFSHRANHTLSSQSRGLAPLFLLFLDCVHQIMEQYSPAFEFNDHYIKFLAFHSQSGFFRNFLFDSEAERIRMEKMAPDTADSCIWSYIKHYCEESALFMNMLYTPVNNVLVIATSESSLSNWPFFFEDEYIHGTPYDIEIAMAELNEMEERRLASSEGITTTDIPTDVFDGRQICSKLYFVDGITMTAKAVASTNPFETDDKISWRKLWDESAMDDPNFEHRDGNRDPKTYEEQVAQIVQKRYALKLILKGEHGKNNSRTQLLQKAHAFEAYSATGTSPQDCNLCHFALYGTVVKTGQRCKHCGVIAHEKCVINVTWPCGLSIDAREKALQEARTVREQSAEKTLRANVASPDLDTSVDTRTITVGRGRPIALHQGYLKKKGTKLKMWTPRWFVLEANTHKLAYYENDMDPMCRGFIDLCELQSVDAVPYGNKAILELKTSSRTLSLLAESKTEATAWKDKIEQVLRE